MSTLYFVASVGGDLANADNALGAPNGTWAGLPDESWTHRWTLDSVGGDPVGTQTITFRVRKADTGGGDPEINSVTLIQGGVSTQIAADFEILSTTGEDYVVTFDSSILDGSLEGVDIELVTRRGGGGPNARGANIDAATWDASFLAVITGAVQSAESGDDTASLTVSADITANVGAVEAGQDTASLTATTTVNSEQGDDEASLTATTAVSASLESTEAGQDTAALTAETVTILSEPGVIDVTETSARPQVTITY